MYETVGAPDVYDDSRLHRVGASRYAAAMKRFVSLVLGLVTSACATSSHMDRVEEKVDRLLANTKRETLAEIFGDQAQEISTKIDDLDQNEKTRLDTVLDAYQEGNANLEDVRKNVFSVLGGSTRVVSSGRGIWVRDLEGDKVSAIARDAKLENCQRVDPEELPESIARSRRLNRFTWGHGELNGEPVLFPWELTMSTFAKEVVENTARRTAQEFLRMSEGRGWNRPVYIKVTTDTEEDPVKISPPGVEEVYVVPGSEQMPESSE